jgi:hypothetical protein
MAMWLFGKRTNIIKAARDDEEDERLDVEELPSFAPEIETGLSEYTEEQIEEDIKELPAFEDEEDRVQSAPAPVFAEESFEEDFEEEEEIVDFPEEVTEDEEFSFEEEGENPREVYEQLASLPYSARNYGVCEDKVYTVHPDGNGGLYFFETFGDYSIGSPDRCKAFVRLKGLKGHFKGTDYATSDFEYLTKSRSWPICVLARNKEQYRSAIDQGYKPYKASLDGTGMLLCKDISLYRIKDLTLRAEVTIPSPVLTTNEYLVCVSRADIEGLDCEKQFKKLCQRVAELVLAQNEDLFFKLQVLKARKNLAVCFPLQGLPLKGDGFGGGVITACAPAKDGTLILQIGSDPEKALPLEEGRAYFGQHKLVLEEE